MKSFKVCGQTILLYSEDKKDCYYDIFVAGVPYRKALTIKMLKSSIKQMHDDWKFEGYGMKIVQDATCLSEINLIPYVR